MRSIEISIGPLIINYRLMKNKILYISIALLSGLFIGWIIFHPSGRVGDEPDRLGEELVSEVWTCAMHPQIRMSEPGKCPICAMDLIPLSGSGYSSVDPGTPRH